MPDSIRPFRAIALLISLYALTSVSVHADGILIPRHEPAGDVFSVKYHHVDVFIDGQAATTRVDQIFHNETDREQEGTYIFPLLKGASIHKFSMFVGEQEVQGKMLGREEARRLYESIVRQRKDPALLEYVDRNAFRASVYPIPPNGDKRIKLEYTELLGKTNSMCRYVYPLSTERFSAKPLDNVRITIDLRSRTPISNIYSPSHIVKVEQTKPNEATVTWTARNVKPDQDLILYYSLEDRDMAFDILTFREPGKQGYFMLLAGSKVAEEDRTVLPKNVVFVLDRTGSMAGEKIVQAKGALRYCLSSLSARDNFNVITFNESPDPLWEGLQPASKTNVDKALRAVDRLDASGGTNINSALMKALKLYPEKSGRNFIVFLTDGLPTVGETNIEAILKNAQESNAGGARVFTFGMGYDVNTHLLDILAEQSGGRPEYVLPNEGIEAKVSSFFAGVSRPVLTDIRIKASGGRISDMFPSDPLPDLFRGSQIVILGRFEGDGDAIFSLSGTTSKGRREWRRAVDLPKRDAEMDFIPQIWAARKIGYLLDQVRLHRNDELINEIILLSREWGIPTEFTSFFVDEPNIALEDADARVGDSIRMAREAQSGRWSVNQSMNSGALKSQSQVFANQGAATSPAGPSIPDGAYSGSRLGNTRGYFDKDGQVVAVDRVQNIGARTFYQQDGRWIDSQVEGRNLKRVQIKEFSDAHFKLLRAYPELARYQRLGNMTVYVNGQAIEIGREGKEDLTDMEIEAIVGSPKAGNTSIMGPAQSGGGSPKATIIAAAPILCLLLGTAVLRRRLI